MGSELNGSWKCSAAPAKPAPRTVLDKPPAPWPGRDSFGELTREPVRSRCRQHSAGPPLSRLGWERVLAPAAMSPDSVRGTVSLHVPSLPLQPAPLASIQPAASLPAREAEGVTGVPDSALTRQVPDVTF